MTRNFLLISALLVFTLGFALGRISEKSAKERSGSTLQSDIDRLTHTQLQEYEMLKSNKEKYDKANEILGRILVVFLADLGLRLNQRPQDIIAKLDQSGSSPESADSAAPTDQVPTPKTIPPVKSEEGESVEKEPEARSDGDKSGQAVTEAESDASRGRSDIHKQFRERRRAIRGGNPFLKDLIPGIVIDFDHDFYRKLNDYGKKDSFNAKNPKVGQPRHITTVDALPTGFYGVYLRFDDKFIDGIGCFRMPMIHPDDGQLQDQPIRFDQLKKTLEVQARLRAN